MTPSVTGRFALNSRERLKQRLKQHNRGGSELPRRHTLTESDEPNTFSTIATSSRDPAASIMSSAIPIRNQSDPNIPIQFHRNSFAHSHGMGGISWGGASVGSWLRDEVLMATKENREVANNFGNLLAGSALSDTMDTSGSNPRDATLGALALSPDTPAYFPSIEATFCKDYSCCGNLLPTLHDLLRHYEEQHISPSPPEESPVLRRIQNIETVSTNDVFLPFDHSQSAQDSHDGRIDASLHGVGVHELKGADLPVAGPGGSHIDDQNMFRAGQQPFAPPSFQPVSQQTYFRYAQTEKPLSMHMNASPGMNRLPAANPPCFPPNARISLGEDDEPTIDDPARQLYVLERSENKPFKCPVIGCEKTYKNQNGLKYHRQHGHQNQKLQLNDDGTYSIMDPLSNTPYPDGMGMEKDKPYRCEICGKRYKNLNGLKYHRAHSTH